MPFDICLNQERLVGQIRAGEICGRVGGNCLKYLKRGWNRKEGRAHKDLEKGGKLGQGVGALKRGSWNSLTNYDYCLFCLWVS